jgi:hypothetical protein
MIEYTREYIELVERKFRRINEEIDYHTEKLSELNIQKEELYRMFLMEHGKI